MSNELKTAALAKLRSAMDDLAELFSQDPMKGRQTGLEMVTIFVKGYRGLYSYDRPRAKDPLPVADSEDPSRPLSR